MRRFKSDILILGSGGAGLVRRAARARRRSVAVDRDRRQGPARQMRLHAHGARRLQRGARRRRLGRAPLHGHDRRRQVAPRPGSRLDAGQRRDRARARARERARLLFRPQSRRHRAPEGVCRTDVRPHGAQRRPDRHRDHQPAVRAGVGARHRPAGRASRARVHSRPPTARRWPRCCWSTCAPANTSSPRRRRCCSPPAAARRCTATTRRRATRAATASPWRWPRACRCATWKWCSSIRPDCSPVRTRG